MKMLSASSTRAKWWSRCTLGSSGLGGAGRRATTAPRTATPGPCIAGDLEPIAQEIEAELRGRAVGDVAAVGLAAVLIAHLLLEDADGQAEELVDRPHPLGVAAGQVIVDGGDVNALAVKRVEEDRQGAPSASCLRRWPARPGPLVHDDAAGKLHVEGPHLQQCARRPRTPGRTPRATSGRAIRRRGPGRADVNRRRAFRRREGSRIASPNGERDRSEGRHGPGGAAPGCRTALEDGSSRAIRSDWRSRAGLPRRATGRDAFAELLWCPREPTSWSRGEVRASLRHQDSRTLPQLDSIIRAVRKKSSTQPTGNKKPIRFAVPPLPWPVRTGSARLAGWG